MNEKTNVMKICESKKATYVPHYYPSDQAYGAMDVANFLQEDCRKVFKTLIVESKSRNYYAILVPAGSELNLKKAAKIFNEKSLTMIHQKDLLPLTGYVHGGCSPIGIKKRMEVLINDTCQNFDRIFFSGGKIGTQIEISAEELKKVINFKIGDVI